MSPAPRSWRVGVDTGGTFTDLVSVSTTGQTLLRKVSSTPSAPSTAVFEALRRTGLDLAQDLDRFILGTTIATNAVIMRRGAPVILLTTAGFEDVLHIQRIDRPGGYDLKWVKGRPYALRRHTFGVRERVLADGSVLTPLTDEELSSVVEELRPVVADMPEASIAISLLFSYLNSAHERLLAERLRQEFPTTPVSVSSHISPVWREYERTTTVVMDSYVHRTVQGFAEDLVEGLQELGIGDRTSLLKSNGGQVALAHSAQRPVDLVLSGLAGGMIAGNYWARRIGTDKAVTLDMGGTSADVGVVVDGQLQFSGSYEVEWGIPIAIPIIDVTTIGAGGSSIATIDEGGLLHVGPESAGADPGPACYGLGGLSATVTDANVVLGRLDPTFFLGGEVTLDSRLSSQAMASIGHALDLSAEETARAIISVAVANMAGAVRLVTVDRGHDYRDFDLIAFGGAGGLHAAQIADNLGMRRAVIPPAPGLVSAFGALIANERIDRRTTLVERLDRDTGRIGRALAELARSVLAEFEDQLGRPTDDVILQTYVSCRYLGQNYEQEIRTFRGHVDRTFELALPVDPTDDSFASKLAEDFHRSHFAAYGYSLKDQAIESVYLGATALILGSPSPLQPYDGTGGRRTGRVWVDGVGWVNTQVADRSCLRPGDEVEGPAVIVEDTSTIYVPEQFVAEVNDDYCLVLSRQHVTGPDIH